MQSDVDRTPKSCTLPRACGSSADGDFASEPADILHARANVWAALGWSTATGIAPGGGFR